MTPAQIGPYLLLALGAAALVAAIVGHFRKLPASSLPLWIFGLAALGLGSYGPTFLTDYADFVRALNAVVADPSQATAIAEFAEIATEAGVSAEAREAVLAQAVASAPAAAEATARTFDLALEKLPEGSENRAVLARAQQRVQTEEDLRAVVRETVDAAADGTWQLSGPARELQPLRELSQAELKRLRLQRATVERAITRSEAAADGDGS
ncbi:MAG: hypothetical protein AAGN46_16275 [Acidobacteriota bacterium]